METQRIQEYIAEAHSRITAGRLDEKLYDEIENFILKNGSRLGKSSDFWELKEVMSEAAARFGKRDISEAQEKFFASEAPKGDNGLNSCAQ